MKIRFLLVTVSLTINAMWLYGGDQPRSKSIQAPLAYCGEIYTQPFGNRSDAWSRQCDNHGVRSYRHRNRGLGFEILDSESEACFVPDNEYMLLDKLVDQVEAQVHYDPGVADPTERLKQAALISKTISDTMAENGFGLYIPTDTLSDALLNRAPTSQRATSLTVTPEVLSFSLSPTPSKLQFLWWISRCLAERDTTMSNGNWMIHTP